MTTSAIHHNEPHTYEGIALDGQEGWSLFITDEKLRFRSHNGWKFKVVPWERVVRREVRGNAIKLCLKNKDEELVFELKEGSGSDHGDHGGHDHHHADVETQLLHLRQDLTEHLMANRTTEAKRRSHD